MQRFGRWRRNLPTLVLACALAGSAGLSPLPGLQAQTPPVPCAALPNAVLVPGTTDVKPFLARVAGQLAGAAAAQQLTIVYQAMGSCTALEPVLGNATVTGDAVYWTPSGEERTCTLGAGALPDLALSDVTVETCTGAPAPAGISQSASMVQPFGFVVPPASSQTAITAAEAYVLFRYGTAAGKQVAPWTDPALVAIRTPASSTQLLIGLAAGVRGTQFSPNLTNVSAGSSAVVAKVAAENATGNAERTIGILSAQRYDENRDKLRMLAFEAYRQQCLGAVYPDATATSFDKRNVRDGHYAIWGYLWAVARTDPEGLAPPRAQKFLSFLNGTLDVPGLDLVAETAKAGAIPACAMTVQRTTDGGPLLPYTPAEPCACRFELATTGSTPCVPCPDGTCATGLCRGGYCETL